MLGILRRTLLSTVCATALWAGLCAPAMGQSEEESAAARSLATQGVGAFGEGRYAEAFDLFTRAESLVHAPPHVLYLARSAEKLGQLIRARELFLKLGREELTANAPQAFRDAQTQAREEARAIEPRLANVTILVKAPVGVKPKMEMDNKVLTAAVLGVPIPADPGKHRLSATAEGYVCDPVELTLTEGGKGQAELRLRLPEEPEGTTPVTEPPSGKPENLTISPILPPASAKKSDRAWMRPTSYAALGVGALGLGAGLYFGLDSRSQRQDADQAEKDCNATTNGCETTDPLAAKITQLDDDARKSLLFAIVGTSVGLVGAGVGTVLLVMSSKQEPRTGQVLPWVGLNSVGLTGTW